MKIRLPMFMIISLVLASFFVACGHGGGQSCAGADPLDGTYLTVGMTDRGGSSSGSSGGSSGARAPAVSGSKAASTPSPAPAIKSPSAPVVNGSKSGTPTAPAVNGSKAGTVSPGPTPVAGKGYVPTYSGSNSIGKTYTYSGVHYIYHPASYWNSRPLDPHNPYDSRNASNPYSPFYGRTIMVPCN